ncbi:MAG: hypothetical protein R6U96_09810 [Promethearchaeia archaeon]
MGDTYVNYKIVSTNKLNNENNNIVRSLPSSFSNLYFSFFESYKVNPYIMRQNLQFFRTDLELKVLFYLFGGKPVQYNNELVDITGGLYFERKDFKFRTDTAEKKLGLIEKHLNRDSERLHFPIAANFENHWVAINSIEGDRISFNDPAVGKKRWGKISKRIPESYRFYFFKYNPESIELFKPKYQTYINSEVEEELRKVKTFTKRLVSPADQELELDQDIIPDKVMNDEGVENEEEIEEPELPKTGDAFMKDLKKRVKESFTDYSDL